MRLPYEFPNIRQFRRLTLEVENSDRRLAIRVKGPFAFLWNRLFWLYFRVFQALTPFATFDGASVYTLYVPPIPSRPHSRHFENFLRRWLFGTRIPLAVTIAVTEKCQCRCGHCSVIPKSPAQPQLSLDEVRSIIAQSVELGTTNITFTGGEALLREDLEAMISSVPAEKAVCQVFTNGLWLSPDRARSLKAAGAWGVQVSLDSPEAADHDRLRVKPGCYEAVQRAVQAALEAGLFVGLSTYSTNDGIEGGRLPKMADLAASWGVHELTVFDVIPTGRLIHQEQVMLRRANRKRLIREGLELRRRYDGRMHVITQSWTNSNTGFARFIGCLAGNYQFHISPGGDMRPCDFTPFSIGNIRTESIAALWKKLTAHPAYRNHRGDCRMQCPSFRRRYIAPMVDRGIDPLL